MRASFSIIPVERM